MICLLKKKNWLLKFLLVIIFIMAVVFFGLLGFILNGDHDKIIGEPKLMIILGCSVKPWGPSILLKDRLNTALEYLKIHKDLIIVVSGGQGPDEYISEAQAMKDYLVEHGINKKKILIEDKSFCTEQNLKFSVGILNNNGYDINQGVIIVSNGFHLARVRILWNKIIKKNNLSSLAAPSSHNLSRLKMFIREPIALLKTLICIYVLRAK